jgi:hypothetical protein
MRTLYSVLRNCKQLFVSCKRKKSVCFWKYLQVLKKVSVNIIILTHANFVPQSLLGVFLSSYNMTVSIYCILGESCLPDGRFAKRYVYRLINLFQYLTVLKIDLSAWLASYLIRYFLGGTWQCRPGRRMEETDSS